MIVFTSQQLNEFGVPDDFDQLPEYVGRVEVLKDEISHSYKNISTYEVVFRLDDKYYRCYYQHEHNEGMSWSGDFWSRKICDVECTEVIPQSVTIITYVDKKQ